MSDNTFISNSIKVNSILLTNYRGEILDITQMATEINIYESIYVNSIVGTVDIVDSNELLNFFPIIGEEYISLDILLPGFDDSCNFELNKYRIYKISDREIKSDKIQTYKLWFTSIEMIRNTEIKSCKAWKEEVTSKMVKDIFRSIGSSKVLEVEQTVGLHNYISTNITPYEAINYLASHRSINLNKLSDYVFFESLDINNRTTKYNFKSLGTLCFSQESIAEFTYHPTMVNSDIGNNVLPYNIENISFKKGFDILEGKSNGLYNQTYIYYDMLRKRYVFQKNTYEDIFSETRNFKLELEKSNKMFVNNSNSPSEYLKFVYVSEFPSRISTSKEVNNILNKGIESSARRSSNEYISTSIEDVMSNLHEKTLYRRDVLLQEFETNKIYINDISGSYKYTIGSIITLNKPNIVINKSNIVEKYGDNNDIFISGRYIIVKSRHRMTRNMGLNWWYKNYLEVSKNTYKNSL